MLFLFGLSRDTQRHFVDAKQHLSYAQILRPHSKLTFFGRSAEQREQVVALSVESALGTLIRRQVNILLPPHGHTQPCILQLTWIKSTNVQGSKESTCPMSFEKRLRIRPGEQQKTVKQLRVIIIKLIKTTYCNKVSHTHTHTIFSLIKGNGNK